MTNTPTPPLSNSVAAETRSRWISFLVALGPLWGLACVIGFFAIADALLATGTFTSVDNLQNITSQATAIAVAAIGMTVVIIAGGIDLSIGVTIALSATVLAVCLRENLGPTVAVLACLLTGCLAGLVNGVLISALKVVPFIITLGTMSIYYGLAKLLADESPVRPGPEQVPQWFNDFVSPSPKPSWLMLSGGVWVALILSVITAAVLRYTVFGRHVFALGSNEATARLCGIRISPTRIAVYTLCGFFAGVAGIYNFGKLSVGNPTPTDGLALSIIAAVVIGGASLNGGRGSILGTLAGTLIIRTISSGCTQLGLKNSYQDIALGTIIIVAVVIDQLRQRLRR